jgi:hypothetical protein
MAKQSRVPYLGIIGVSGVYRSALFSFIENFAL